MLTGTIIENSLTDPGVLENLHVVKSWSEGDWNLHVVEISKEQAMTLAKYIDGGPWYMHFWDASQENILVVFKDVTFEIKRTDKSTWAAAIEHGTSIGIPENQLDFLTTM